MNKTLKILCMLMVTIMLIGCGKREPMYAQDFQEEMENRGFTVEDVTDSTDDSQFLHVLVAYNDDDEGGYIFGFYYMKEDENAKALFDSAKGKLEALEDAYSGDKIAVIADKSNKKYGNYSVSVSDFYGRIIRIENTMLYVTTDAEYREKADQIIKELGY